MVNKRLIKRRQNIVDRLPDPSELVRGSLVKRYLRCGKTGCRCRQGKGHGPYYYLMTTLGPGKTRMVLISKDQLPMVGRQVKNLAKYRKGIEQITEINTQMLVAERKTEMNRVRKGAGKKR